MGHPDATDLVREAGDQLTALGARPAAAEAAALLSPAR
jgi:hypothetical protein